MTGFRRVERDRCCLCRIWLLVEIKILVLLAASNSKVIQELPSQVGVVETPEFDISQSSPKPLCPSGRTVDVDAILDVISKAQLFIHIAVMDYFPLTLYTPHTESVFLHSWSASLSKERQSLFCF